MKPIDRLAVRTLAWTCLVSSLAPVTLYGQALSLGLRGTGSVPTGAFAQADASANASLIDGAKTGFGYGLDVGLGFGPIGLYGSFDHIAFDCQTATCRTDGKYKLQGVTAGVKLSGPSVSLLRPYVKAGVTFNDLQGGYGGSSSNVLTTDKTPGYEVGLGADVTLPGAGFVSIAPQLRYVGQNLKAKIPGVSAPSATSQGVTYFSFDLGLSVHTPFGK